MSGYAVRVTTYRAWGYVSLVEEFGPVAEYGMRADGLEVTGEDGGRRLIPATDTRDVWRNVEVLDDLGDLVERFEL